MTDKTKITILLSITFIAIIGTFLAPRIPQDLNYHNFIDQQSYFGIPNFWNVLSNLPFLIVGLAGFKLLWTHKHSNHIRNHRIAYSLFSLGVCLVAAGSSFYHLNPSNETLVWDRLPMTVAFMSLFAIIIADYVSSSFAKKALWPLLIIGASSVVYWHITETHGNGDLRLYALVQFLPMMLIPLIVLMFNDKDPASRLIWIVLGMYLLSKLAELADQEIYNLLGVLSGHSIKHVLAAVGAYFLLVRAKKLSL